MSNIESVRPTLALAAACSADDERMMQSILPASARLCIGP